MKKILFFLFVVAQSILNVKAQGNSWTIYNTANSGIADNLILKIEVDSANNKYFATEEGGLSIYNNSTWTNINMLNSPLPSNEVSSVAWESNGTLWIGADGGALRKSGSAYALFTPGNSGLPDIEVATIEIERGYIKWFGTELGGLARYNDTTWTVYHTGNSGIAANDVVALAIDTNNHIWTGSEVSGVSYFDGNTWTIYNTANSDLPSDLILDIEVDAMNNIWIATEDGGLAKFNGTNWTVYNMGNSGIPDNAVLAVAFDMDGNVWIGTENAGAAKFDGVNWTVYNTANSDLPENVITDIKPDKVNGIWFGTETSGAAKLCAGPAAAIIPSGNTNFCNGDSVVLGTNSGNYTYQWYMNAQPVSNETGQLFTATQPGNYYVVVTDTTSCGTTSNSVSINVFPTPLAPVITQSGNLLASNYTSGNQWYYNNVVIAGATSQIYAPTQNGFYSVEYTDGNGCTSMSALFGYTINSINETETKTLRIFPNPATDYIYIQSGNHPVDLLISDVLGKKVMQKQISQFQTSVNISFLNNGVYFVHLVDNAGKKLTARLVKQ